MPSDQTPPLHEGFVELAGSAPADRPLITVPLDEFRALQSRVEELERELDRRKTEESIAYFARRGYTDDMFITPDDPEVQPAVEVDVDHPYPIAKKVPIKRAEIMTKLAALGERLERSERREAIADLWTNYLWPVAHTPYRPSTGHSSSQPGKLRHKRKTTQGD